MRASFVSILLFLFISLSAFGGDSFLKISLMNDRQLGEIEENAGLKAYTEPSVLVGSTWKFYSDHFDSWGGFLNEVASRLSERSPVCGDPDFGTGCLFLTFQDDAQLLEGTSHLGHPQINQTLLLHGYAEVETRLAKTEHLQNTDYEKAFSKADLYDNKKPRRPPKIPQSWPLENPPARCVAAA